MSGGVDSSVAAALLVEHGVETVGVWMRLHDGADSYSEFQIDPAARSTLPRTPAAWPVSWASRSTSSTSSASSTAGVIAAVPERLPRGSDAEPLRRLQLGREVRGAARPGAARLYGCDAVATGHYARVDAHRRRRASGRSALPAAAGAIRDKDQSYFLYGLRPGPAGGDTLPAGRADQAPRCATSPDATGSSPPTSPRARRSASCADGDYRDELERHASGRLAPGPLVDADGRQVGEHAGAAAYTVGQRSGLGVALGERQYVAAIDAPANLIRLGRREDLEVRHFVVQEVSFVDGMPPGPFAAQVRIRHRAEPVRRLVSPIEGGAGWQVELERPVWAPAPGQAAVFYDSEAVIGGGRIAPRAAVAALPAAVAEAAPAARSAVAAGAATPAA